MRIILVTLTLFALGACKAADKDAGAGNNAANQTNAARDVRNYVAEVTALSEPERNAVFFRAIRDAGLSCRAVSGSEQIEATRGTVTWRAQCEQGMAHLVQVMPDGTAIVVSR